MFKHRHSIADGRRGKSFSGCRGANEYVRSYPPPMFICFLPFTTWQLLNNVTQSGGFSDSLSILNYHGFRGRFTSLVAIVRLNTTSSGLMCGEHVKEDLTPIL